MTAFTKILKFNVLSISAYALVACINALDIHVLGLTPSDVSRTKQNVDFSVYFRGTCVQPKIHTDGHI